MQILHPERYHGHSKKPPFFEGWYYKLVDAAEQRRYAVIPGIFLSDDPEEEHAFVQVLDGVTGQVTYHRYPASAFWAARDAFDIHVGPSRFTTNAVSLSLSSPAQVLKGDAYFEGLSPWPISLLSPGIMGWYSWVPFMETYHGVLSLDHEIHGSFTVDGRTIEWTGGRGYIEKDWGASFPSAWIWLQTNHFARPRTSLSASIATIPWLRSSFRGFIIGLWTEGLLYRFATYTGAEVEALEVSDEKVRWTVRDRTYRLEIVASRASAGLLRGPTQSDMSVRVPETLSARVQVRLSRGRPGQEVVILDDVGRYAGLEVAGDLERLLA
jgi:tocopherol cyclase